MPEKIVNLGGTIEGFPKTPIVPDIPSGDPLAGKMSVNDMVTGMMGGIKTKGASDIPAGSIYSGTRYTETRPGTDYEEMAGQQQSSWEKWRNASAKMVGTAATSFVAGTAGLVYGAGSAIMNQKLSKLIDNDVTRTMDQFSTALEDIAPNYYTHAEQDAEWYSPKNILTANFWSDKVLKNLGFSLGAMAGGVAWGSLLKGIGITNALVRAGQGLEAATAVETAMTAAPKLGKYAAFENALSATAQKYIKNPISAVLKDSDRILTSTMGTFGEASIEGLQGMNQFRSKLIQEYKDTYGVDPQGADLEQINMYADKVGVNIWGQNTLLLTATNYIQLPKILGSSRKADKALINDVEQAGIGTEFKSVMPTTKFGRLLQGTKGLGSLLFAPSEAFEEGMQFSIQSGVQNYFDRAYKNREDGISFFRGVYETMGATLGEGVDETLTSKEGLESILIGGLSGGIQQAGVFGSYKDEQGNTRYGFGKSGTIGEQGVFGMGGEKAVNTDMAISALNKTNIKKALQDGSKFVNIGIGSQRLRQQAIAFNDTLSEKDYEQDFTLSYIMPRVKYGKIDSINQELDYYQNQAMNEQGFDQLKRGGIANENETQGQFLARINNIKETAQSADKLYSTLNDKYSTLVNKDGGKLYSDDVIDKMVYAASKIKNYDERIPQLNASLLKAGLVTQDIIENGMVVLDSVAKVRSNIDKLDVDDDTKENLQNDFNDLVEVNLRRYEFIDQYNDIKKNPDKYKDVDVEDVSDTPETPKKIIKIKTKNGEKDIEIGTPYHIGRVVSYDKNGKEVYDAPIITILGENEDGTIKIQDDRGIRNISKDVLLSYGLGKISDLEKNKKFQYFKANWNNIFEHKGIKGKNGKPVRGRLEYSTEKDILLFTFINEKGKRRSVDVKNTQFVAQKGYKEAMVKKVGEVTPVEQRFFDDMVSEKESEDDIRNNINGRKQVVVNLVNSSKSRLEEINKELEAGKKRLADIQEKLEKAPLTKKGTPRKDLNKVAKVMRDLSNQKESLEKTLDLLDDEKESLEINLPYLEDLLNSVDTLTENYNDVVEDIKDDIDSLEEMIDSTNDSIESGKSLLKDVSKALEDAVALLDDWVKRFREENPNIPLNVEALRERLEKYYGEEGAQRIIDEKAGYMEDLMDLQDQIDLFSDELNIPDLTKQSQKLSEKIAEAEKKLNDLIQKQIAKASLLEAFESKVRDYELAQAENELIVDSDVFINKVLGTLDRTQQTLKSADNYDPDSKKSNKIVPSATVAGQKLLGYERSNRFGNNLNKFENKESIKGVLITSENEAELGLSGLMDALKGDNAEVKANETIALVMVEEGEDGVLRLVGEDGKPLTADKSAIDNAIFQVMPDSKLRWSKQYGGGSMFREDNEDTKYIREKYDEWRKAILKNPSLTTYKVQASFGVPQRVMVKNADGIDQPDYGAKVSVADAGLITVSKEKNELLTERLITIPTTGDSIERGSTSYSDPVGFPFLLLNNAYVKLNNRKLTKDEANTIYQAIERLSDILFENGGQGDLEDPEARRLYNWLKSVIYWGTPANKAGYNSVWFDRVDTGDGLFKKELRLFLSNKGESIRFTPQSIRDNKGFLVDLLQEMYNNVNSSLVTGGKNKEWNVPYEEITSISPDGTIQSKTWPNYQSYLLSSEGRSSEEIPLTTNMKPVKEDEVNREGVYFMLPENVDKFIVPNKKVKTLTKEEIAAKAKQQAAGKTKTTGFKLDGKTTNVFTSDSGLKIQFAGNISLLSDLDPKNLFEDKKALQILPGADLTTALDTLKVITKDEEKAKRQIKLNVYNALRPYIEEYRISQGETEMEFTFDDEDFEEAENVIKTEEASTADEDSMEFTFTEDDNDELNDQIQDLKGDELLRVKLDEELDNFEGEDWAKVEAFAKDNLPPSIPIYRLQNILKASNGLQAYGMFKDGAIYVFKNAEIGTTYHEVFHAIWNMFTTPGERKSVEGEFRRRSGSFTDRMSGREVEYSKATDREIEEQLAEELRSYIHDGIEPPAPADRRSFIRRIFDDFINFVKNLLVGTDAKNNTERLFQKINTGYYKTFVPQEAALSRVSKGIVDLDKAEVTPDSLLRIKNLSSENIHDIMQQMTYLTLYDFTKNNKSLFNIPSMNKKEIYRDLKYKLGQTVIKKAVQARKNVEDKVVSKNGTLWTADRARPIIANNLALWKTIRNQWDEIMKKHEEYLQSYSIQFDENDELELGNQDKGKDDPFGDATKIDNFKKANAAIKLLLSTLPIVYEGKPVISSINGVKLVPMSQAFMAIMNETHTSLNPEDMIERIRKMAINDENYRKLYERLTKTDYKTKTSDLSKIKDRHNLQIITSLWKTFKKQSPDVKNVYIFENGDIEVGDSNLASAARQVESQYESNLIETIKGKSPFFTWSPKDNAYLSVPKAAELVPLKNLENRLAFLNHLGIEFTTADYMKMDFAKQAIFDEAIGGLRDSLMKVGKIATISGKILKMKGRLMSLSLLRAQLDNPEFDSTYFNVKGERTQSFIGPNAMSDLHDFVSQLKKFNEGTLKDTQYEYLFTDNFSKHSVKLDRMFDLTTTNGDRKKGSEKFLKPGYVDGTINEDNGKKKESSKLTYPERLVQQINLMLKGYFYNLVPGDSSMEHMVYMGNEVTEESLLKGYGRIHDIFKGYLIDEINVSRENRKIVKLKLTDEQKAAGVKQREATDLRFFKVILDEKTHNAIVKDKTTDPAKIYDDNKAKIDKAVEDFILNKSKGIKSLLVEYGILKYTAEGINVNNLDFKSVDNADEKNVNRELNAIAANFVINNIELHKLMYSDPYLYSDELKRVKNFNSPHQSILSNSEEMNAAMNNVMNDGYATNDIGRTDFNRDMFRTITLEDVEGVIDLEDYDSYDETDGGGVITMKANRNLRFRAADWNDEEERQYKYDVAWEKKDKSVGLSEEEISKKGLKLTEEEEALYNAGNPGVQSAYTPLKPKAAGNKGNGKSYNDVMLDKYALYPLSYRIQKEIAKGGGRDTSNAIKLYNKMQAEDVDYAVFKSGRKVGAEKVHSLYNEKDGSFNTDSFGTAEDGGIVNVPFSILSIQSEVPSKEKAEVTRGSQVTKLITMDFMEAGVPVDFMEEEEDFDKRLKAWFSKDNDKSKSKLYREIMNNQTLLKKMMDQGYQSLLKRLGIGEKNGKFYLIDPSESAKILRGEILKRESNDNISEALEGYMKGDTTLEATPLYKIVRNILYSIADKEVVSSKITGGLKVQISSAMLESVKAAKETVNGKTGYTSDILKFYKDDNGQRVCEIMVGRWFKSDKTDAELMEYFNNTEEGKKQLAALAGLAFRIPTQKQNSIDAFRIAQFLPKEFGDSVVIPSALVKKVGSDFDIDKLSIYLKNVYEDPRGNIKLVPFLGFDKEAKDKFTEMFNKGEFLKKEQMQELDRIIEEKKDSVEDVSELGKLLASKNLGNILSEEEITEAFVGRITKEELKDKLIDKLYKQSLQNAYIQSCEDLVTHPKNFKQLIKPNSAQKLKDLADDITRKRGFESFDYSSVNNLLSIPFMTRLRHAFVTGKYAIGIAAVGQTNHSLNQRQPTVIDPARLSIVDPADRPWLGDSKIKFKEYNSLDFNGQDLPTLSMIKNKAGEHISDIIGMFIDGYVDIAKGPWIMELGASPNVTGTYLFLAKIGVPMKTIGYFMNQPIVRDYLDMIESAGYSWLFIQDYVDLALDKYKASDSDIAKVKSIPSETSLGKTVGVKKLTPIQNAEQQFILKEFLKYAMMANHLFQVTQGTNYDTASFNDPFLVFKKSEQFKKAQRTIISSADDLLNNSFIGDQKRHIEKIRDVYADTILKSDKPSIRMVIQDILKPYVDSSDRDFIKISQKAVADLFDWAVQTNTELNKEIKKILISTKSASREIKKLVEAAKKNPKHPLHNNHVINILDPKIANNNIGNIKVLNTVNKVYDQNQIIYGFTEIKNYLKSVGAESVYDNLVKLSVLQSGLSTSPFSFTSLLPYEDFKNVYNNTLADLEIMPNLDVFRDLNVFHRTNWSNDDVVPFRKAQYKENPITGKWSYNSNMRFKGNDELNNDIKAGIIPQVLRLDVRSREAGSDVIVYSWEKRYTDEKGKLLSYKKDKELKKQMRSEGDFSYIQKGLFKKVYDGEKPFNIYDYYNNPQYVYKMINAWGDSYRAKELYEFAQKSVIDNGFVPVESEVADESITPYFSEESILKGKKENIAKPSNQANLDKIIAELSQLKKTKGLTAAQMKQLFEAEQQRGKIKKSKC